jgi:hypothetical protein
MSYQVGLPGLSAGIVVPRSSHYNFEEFKERKIDDNQLNFDEIDKYHRYHSPKRYQDEFIEYIKRTSDMSFNILGKDINFQIPYKHRWEKSYRKGILRQMYQLDSWAKRHRLICGMLSLTSAQTGFTDIEILERLKESWSKLADNLRVMGFLYFALYEPHESGVPHMHVMIFGGLIEAEQKNVEAGISTFSEIMSAKIARLDNLWHKRYEMGAEGIDFKYSAGLRENINSIVNYLMKYLSKTIISDILNNPALVRFHSLFFETGSRMFSSSRYLSYVMRRIKVTSMQIDAIFCENREIYNRSDSSSVPSKYQTVAGVRKKYDLLPFEIKSKIERNLPFVPFGNNEQHDKETGQLKFIPLKKSFENFASLFEIMMFNCSIDIFILECQSTF